MRSFSSTKKLLKRRFLWNFFMLNRPEKIIKIFCLFHAPARNPFLNSPFSSLPFDRCFHFQIYLGGIRVKMLFLLHFEEIHPSAILVVSLFPPLRQHVSLITTLLPSTKSNPLLKVKFGDLLNFELSTLNFGTGS